VLGQIWDQTAVPLHSFDHWLPGPAAVFPAVKEDDSGRSGRTGFANEQIHSSDPSTGCQLAKCAWFTCVATRKALAATVKLGFKPALEGKNEVSTT
jgi:hypothetical protein